MKLILKLALVLLLGLLLLGGAGYSFLPPAARKTIENGTGSALGTPTHLEGIDAGFGLNTTLGIAGFTADQPQGFDGPPLLEIGKIQVGVNLFSTLSDTVRVREVTLDGLHLRLIQNGKENNFLKVYESLRKLTKGDSSSPSEPEGDASSAKNIEIGLVKVSGVGATFDLTGIPGIEQSYSFELPPFEIDLSKSANENRMQNVEQATARIVERLIEQTIANAQAQVSPELALLIGGDVAGLKERAREELDKLKSKAGAEVDKLKEKAKSDLQKKLGEKFGDSLKGESGKQLNKAIGNKVDGLLEKGADAVLEGSTSDTLKKQTDKLLEKGSKDLRKELDGLLKKKD
ncbi:MAG: hypothetical protein GY930_13595 [bacterium]|nr:hypothetical protein [bacterium]